MEENLTLIINIGGKSTILQRGEPTNPITGESSPNVNPALGLEPMPLRLLRAWACQWATSPLASTSIKFVISKFYLLFRPQIFLKKTLKLTKGNCYNLGRGNFNLKP